MNEPGTGPSTQRLGRYHLSESLGGGPTGEVFRGKVYGVAGMDREFAVKRFHRTLVVNPRAANALAAAARTYGALEHPRVARLHEFGSAGGETFSATEFVPGLDLARLMAEGSLSLGTAAALVVQIGRALGYAHGRGLAHLGVCPTNVICTEQGEIKVTDFGVMTARLSSNPAADESLRMRLCYLAPEQLEGKATSPATDVYQLGTLAYELMVGRRPYQGRNNQELAKQILSLPIPDSRLPKAYDKFLRRALARAPFERFPDAGAMADALEAALRSAPAPGTGADAGKAVSKVLRMLSERRESQASGALSFPIPAPPSASKEEVLERIATPPPIPSIPGATRSGGHGAAKSKEQAKLRMAKTMLSKIPEIPRPKPRAVSVEDTEPGTGEHDIETRVADYAESESTFGGQTADGDPTMLQPEILDAEMSPTSDLELGPAGTDPSVERRDLLGGVDSAYTPPDEAPTKVQPTARVETNDEETAVRGADLFEAPPFTVLDDDFEGRPTDAMPAVSGDDRDVSSDTAKTLSVPFLPELPDSFVPAGKNRYPSDDEPSKLIVVEPGGPESVPMPPLPPSTESEFQSRAHRLPPELAAAQKVAQAKSRQSSRALPAALAVAFAIAAAFLGYQYFLADGDSETKTATSKGRDPGIVIPPVAPTKPVAEHGDAGSAAETLVAKASDGGASEARLDAGSEEVTATTQSLDASVDTTSGSKLDAGTEAETSGTPPPDGTLRIDSKPSGAKVYLDGTMVGTTPVDLDASSDSHRLALLLAGYDLHTAQIDGAGELTVALKEVTPPDGPGGIKIRCRNKNRYYVYVDDNPVGELCPTERIGVDKGKHVVEIYDPLTDSRKAFNVNVEDTRLSVRVRVD